MEDLEMKYETMIRKIFQCGRSDDPLGRLADADDWGGINSEEFSQRYICQAWAVLSRIQLQYFDSKKGREVFHKEILELEEYLLNATTNRQIITVMDRLTAIVETLDLSEFPHISYSASNDN